MILLDTNVLSALMLTNPDPVVARWIDRLPRATVFTTAVSVYEIRLGLDRLPIGWRRAHIERYWGLLLSSVLQDRVLPFDQAAAERAGALHAYRAGAGFNDDHRDVQIAGIALSVRAPVATRNIRDFRGFGVPLVNPWDAT